MLDRIDAAASRTDTGDSEDEVMYTPLHRALNMEPCPLTIALVRDAVAARVSEREDLDWKQVLPKHPGRWVEEFAKDIAAMANAGGGMIVYGVSEDRATSEADEICDVGPVTDTLLRELRGAAFSGITPPVLGVQTFVVADQDEGDTVLAILIPPSDDSPHLVFRQDMFGAPLRLGTQTGWMKERMLESAYRQRFVQRDRRLTGLDDLFDEAVVPFHQPPRVWMVAVARPEMHGHQGRIDSDTARKILSGASENTPVGLRGLSPLGQIARRMNDPVLGLRRWTFQSNNFDTGQIYGCRITLQFDGSITVAMAVAGDRMTDTRTTVLIPEIEAVLVDLAGIAVTAGREFSLFGGYTIKASLLSDGSELISLTEPAPMHPGFYDSEARPIPRFVPVTGRIPTDEGAEPILEGIREVALDLINQAGARTLHLLRASHP